MGYDAEFKATRTGGAFGARGLKADFGSRATRASFLRLVPLRPPDANAMFGGLAAGSASFAAYVTALLRLIGEAAASASAAGALAGGLLLAGSSAGAATASGGLSGGIAAQATAEAFASTAGSLYARLGQTAGTSAGSASLSAILGAQAPMAFASAAGSSSTNATFGVASLNGGTADGSATLQAALANSIPSAGSTAGAATSAAFLLGRLDSTGATAGTGSTTSALSSVFLVAGSTAGTGTAAGLIVSDIRLAGSASGSATTSAAIFGSLQSLEGITGGTAATNGAIVSAVSLAATTSASSTTAGSIVSGVSLASSAAGSATTSASIVSLVAVAGSTAGTGSTAGDLDALLALDGSTAGTSSTSANLDGRLALAGSAAGSATASGTEASSSIPATAIIDDASDPVVDSTDDFIIYYEGPVLESLALNLDAGDISSYAGSGTNWVDLSGNGKNATLTNGPTFSALNGGAIAFDGTNDYAQLPVNIQPANNNYSVEAWFNAAALPSSTDYNYAVCVVGNRGQYDWLLTFGDGTTSGTSLGFRLYDSVNGWATPVETGAINANTWHQVIVTSSSVEGIKLYRNGSLVSSNATVRNVGAGSGFSRIASETFGVNRYFNGRISIVRFYSKALTATEVARNFNTLKGRYALT